MSKASGVLAQIQAVVQTGPGVACVQKKKEASLADECP